MSNSNKKIALTLRINHEQAYPDYCGTTLLVPKMSFNTRGTHALPEESSAIYASVTRHGIEELICSR